MTINSFTSVKHFQREVLQCVHGTGSHREVTWKSPREGRMKHESDFRSAHSSPATDWNQEVPSPIFQFATWDTVESPFALGKYELF